MFDQKKYDISEEFIIQRHLSGIKLVKPDAVISKEGENNTIKNLLAQPFCVYFLSKTSLKLKLNEHSAAACGFISAHQGVGKTVAEVLKPASAQSIMNNDREVMNLNRIKIVEEFPHHKNNQSVEGLTIKVPWYDANDKIVGVFGCSVMYGVQSIPEFLLEVKRLNLLNEPNKLRWLSIKNIFLTKRETQVLSYTLRGRSAKEVGRILHISSRTIEYHLENLKLKFKSSTKAELIDTVISHLCGPFEP